MKFKLVIYRGSNRKTYVTEKLFDSVEEVECMLEQYEGFWCQVIDMSKHQTVLEGAFDEDFLDETYYQK